MSRKIKILFTLSVLANVIFIGLAFGGMHRIYSHWDHNDFKKELESLPEDVQQRIDNAFTISQQEMRTLFSASREARQQVRDTLNAETFNMESYKEAVEKLNQIRYRMMQTKANKTGAIAAELNANDRRKFAGYLMRGGSHKGGFMQDKENFVGEPRPPKGDPNRPAPGHAEPFDPVMLPMPDVE